MDKKKLLIMIGCKMTGKDFSSKPYIEMGYKKIAFADPLRDMCWEILGYQPNEDLSYEDLKKSVLSTEKQAQLFGKRIPWFNSYKITSIRQMLQNIGSLMKEKFGVDYWANIWKQSVLASDSNVVCTDCRFPNEIKKALSLTKNGYEVVFKWCCYENADFTTILADTHESEALAQFIYWNQSKYNLSDGSTISTQQIKTIIKDFEKFQSSKEKLDNLF